jgi:hypothetical protein
MRFKFPANTLPHSMPTITISNGTANAVILERVLGHESLATTGKYTDLIKGDLIRAVHMNPVTGNGNSMISKPGPGNLALLRGGQQNRESAAFGAIESS